MLMPLELQLNRCPISSLPLRYVLLVLRISSLDFYLHPFRTLSFILRYQWIQTSLFWSTLFFGRFLIFHLGKTQFLTRNAFTDIYYFFYRLIRLYRNYKLFKAFSGTIHFIEQKACEIQIFWNQFCHALFYLFFWLNQDLK
jgi:hypothetical protein